MDTKAKISIIAAIGKNRELGKDNKLLWHIPADMKRFKQLTSGHAVIMGRKTFESIGRPLPNRLNIVITRDIKKARDRASSVNLADAENTPQSASRGNPSHFMTPAKLTKVAFVLPNLIACSSIENAIDLAKHFHISHLGSKIKEDEIFVIGGGEVYRQALPYADKLYLTILDETADADTFFPDYSPFKKVVYKKERESGGYRFIFIELER